jgi:hypothetical protein
MKVSATRNEHDMRQVFDEAQQNSIRRITMATAMVGVLHKLWQKI